MNSFILIDGIALYLVLIFIIGITFGFVMYGLSYVKKEREYDKLNTEYKKLRGNYNKLIGMYHRDTFKVPEIDTLGDSDV